MIHLESVSAKRATAEVGRFPFTVPAVRALDSLQFTAPVTFFVGENGSGKSTLLEGIAAAAAWPAVGSASVEQDQTLGPARELASAFRLAWKHRTHRGFFLRAEDFFGFTKSLATLRAELTQRLDEIAMEYEGRSAHARGLAEGPVRASLADMTRRYGVDLDAHSHGQSFLLLFKNRFAPGGLYLLDEPEAPLSPHSQLALLMMLDEMVAQDAQFIIATHSPLLLAFPGATIYSFDETPVRTVAFEDLDHVTVTREFLNDPTRYLQHLVSIA